MTRIMGSWMDKHDDECLKITRGYWDMIPTDGNVRSEIQRQIPQYID